jgi:hypothetical protein
VARERLQMHGITPAYSQQAEDHGVAGKARTVAASGVRP